MLCYTGFSQDLLSVCKGQKYLNCGKKTDTQSDVRHERNFKLLLQVIQREDKVDVMQQPLLRGPIMSLLMFLQ